VTDLSALNGATDRMLLRPFRESDLEVYADMHRHEEVARYLLWEPRDVEACRSALERHSMMRLEGDGDGITLAGFEKDGGAFVGEFVLFLRSKAHRGGEVGYILHPDAQGRGLATEGAGAMLHLGFDAMRMHRIIGRIDARNTGSAAVLEKLGMRREAHFVRNEIVKGEWTDEVVYAILAEEWSSSPTRSVISWNTTAPAEASAPAGAGPPPMS
jgi:RimJ/RimL family protein N-acetyltransferase